MNYKNIDQNGNSILQPMIKAQEYWTVMTGDTKIDRNNI